MGKGGVRTSAFTYFWLYLVIGDCQYQFQFGDLSHIWSFRAGLVI